MSSSYNLLSVKNNDDAVVEPLHPRWYRCSWNKFACYGLGAITSFITIAIILVILFLTVIQGDNSNSSPPPPISIQASAPEWTGALITSSGGGVSLSFVTRKLGSGGSILFYTLQQAYGDDTTKSAYFAANYTITPGTSNINITNLISNQIYCFRVRSVDGQGPSPWSVVIRMKTSSMTSPLAPQPPDMNYSIVNATSIIVQGNPPLDCGGGVITSYTVSMLTSTLSIFHCTLLPFSSHSIDDAGRIIAPQYKCSVTNLLPNTLYSLAIHSNNAHGSSDSVKFSIRTSSTSPPHPALPPSDFNIINIDSDSVMLEWNCPLDDGGSLILSYIIDETSASSGHRILTVPFVGYNTTTQYKIMKLMSRSSYVYKVQVLTKVGGGEWTDNKTIQTLPPSIPSKPTLTLVSQSSSLFILLLKHKSMGCDSSMFDINLQTDDWWRSFNATTVLINSSVVNDTITDGYIWQLVANNNDNNNMFLPGSIYHLRVRSKNSVGWSEWSDSLAITTINQCSCGNSHDIQQQHSLFSVMKSDIQSCLIKCILSSSDSCSNSCITSQLGLSLPCSQCWTNEGHCTLKHCKFQCLSPSSDACQQCSQSNCFQPCVDCTGLPTWAFPS